MGIELFTKREQGIGNGERGRGGEGETRRHGDTETRRHGDTEIRRHPTPHTDGGPTPHTPHTPHRWRPHTPHRWRPHTHPTPPTPTLVVLEIIFYLRKIWQFFPGMTTPSRIVFLVLTNQFFGQILSEKFSPFDAVQMLALP